MLSASGSTIKVSRGDTGVLAFHFGTVLTAGESLILCIGKNVGETPLVTKTITTVAGRTQTISLTASDTDLDPGQYCWDIRLEDSGTSGVVTLVPPSQFVVLPVVRGDD